jgi:hypothetical protein
MHAPRRNEKPRVGALRFATLRRPRPMRLRPPISYDMVPHMKTTIEIADSLFEQTKRAAAREGTSVRALVERGLRTVLAEQKSPREFKLRRASFKGKGLQHGGENLSWDRVRDLVYEGRGA